jgi:hypothetical protein
MNHLAIFGTDYLELIAAPPGDTQRPEIMDAPDGLNGLVFGTEDSAATYAALRQAGVPVLPPGEFSRPVALPAGERNAVFRTVRLSPGAVPAGRLYFCHHFTRDLVWRDEWRHHANGATGIARAAIAARDPDGFGSLFGRMFGADALRPIAGGLSLTVGVSRIDVLTPAALDGEFGDAAPTAGGRDNFMAVLTFRTRSIVAAAHALQAGGIIGARQESGQVVVPATAAFGATLVFCL